MEKKDSAQSGNWSDRVQPASGGGEGIRVEKVVFNDADKKRLSIGTAKLPSAQHGEKPK